MSHEAIFRTLGMLPEAARGRMARMYCDSLDRMLPELAAAVGAGRAEDARTIAHKIAGAAAMMQDEQLASLTRRMEEMILAGQPQEAYALWPLAQDAAAQALGALRAAFP